MFTPSKIDAAFARKISPNGAKDVAIDVAGSGTNRTVSGDRTVGYWIDDAGHCERFLSIGPADIAHLPDGDIEGYLDWLLDEVDGLLQRLGEVRSVRVDSDGVGAGLARGLARRGWKVVEFHGGSLPPTRRGALDTEEKRVPSELYDNLRCYGYWYLAKRLPELDLPQVARERLRDDLLATRPTFSSSLGSMTAKRTKRKDLVGKKLKFRAVLAKDDISATTRRSPDDGDALMMAVVPIRRRRKPLRVWVQRV